VEVSTDDGKSWSLASLQDPVLAISQTRFRFPWIWDGGPAVIQSRATDETGYLQPTHQQLIAERGPLETGSLFYHMNAIQSWKSEVEDLIQLGLLQREQREEAKRYRPRCLPPSTKDWKSPGNSAPQSSARPPGGSVTSNDE
jgi:hypothetical protein